MNLLRKAGTFYKKTFNKWEKYFGILHGPYLYVFNNMKDETPLSFLYMRGVEITRISAQDCGKEFAFKFKNRLVDEVVAFEKEKDMQ